MKKKTLLFIALTVLALGNFTDAFAKLGYFGNGWTQLGFYPRIVDETFQSWPDQPQIVAYPDSCPSTVPDNKIYLAQQKFQVAISGNSTYVPFQLDSCLISNHCPPVANAGSKLRNPGVSNGFIEIKRYYAGGSTPSVQPGVGHLILGPISMLEQIQYSTSSNGGTKRGFLLEISQDGGSTWGTLRLEAGNLNLSTSGDDDTECSNGMQWQEANVYGVDCLLRFSNYGGQMVRIHDVKIWGESTFTLGVNSTTAKKDLIAGIYGNRVNLTDYADVEIFNVAGNLVMNAKEVKELNISSLESGIYILKAKNESGVYSRKFIK